MSFKPDPYDPDAVDERPKSGYFTRKDLRVLVAVAVLLGPLFYPLYILMRRNSQETICTNNMKNIQEAISMYREYNDDRFPPICAQGDSYEPALVDGRAVTWATTINDYMSKRASFLCPSADDDEVVHAVGSKSTQPDLPMSYGMYSPWSGAAAAYVGNEGQAVVIAETSNFGAQDTYDPYPFKRADGTVVKSDGFFIGWDKGNYVEQWQNSASSAVDMPRYVTRLAFFGTGGGNFGEKARGRHSGKIHVLYVDGHLGMLSPNGAAVSFSDPGGDLNGRWTTRGWAGANNNRR